MTHSIRDIFDKALMAVDPYRAVCAEKDRVLAVLKEKKLDKIFLAGFGKAVVPMAKALMDSCGDIIEKGALITKYGHSGSERFTANIQLFEAGHPVPDENGLRATQQMLNLLREADGSTLVVFLISGGGSALLTCPYDGISLQEKQLVTDLLLKAGANIHELNAVRKHISAVKGGRLAEVAYPATILSLVLSDVIGDSLDVIASGPTTPDPTTYGQSLGIINKYGLTDSMPDRVIDHLSQGSSGIIQETPKPGDTVFRNTQNVIVGSNALALDAAKNAAETAGYRTIILSANLSGEASMVASYLANISKLYMNRLKPGEKACLIAGGETTVTVRGSGKGGRNTEMALAFGIEIQGESGVQFLSAGTDGQDGPTDAAGAIVDGQMVEDAIRLGLDPSDYLKRNDSYTFFKKMKGLIITGPTGTNVMDIQIIFLEKK